FFVQHKDTRQTSLKHAVTLPISNMSSSVKKIMIPLCHEELDSTQHWTMLEYFVQKKYFFHYNSLYNQTRDHFYTNAKKMADECLGAIN
ncbi:hypothetical protein MKX03_026796, partial [Papaver bracteatum]